MKTKTLAEIKDAIKIILHNKFDIAIEDIEDNDNLINDLGLDSLDCVELIMELEREFNVTVNDDIAEKILVSINTVATGMFAILNPTQKIQNNKMDTQNKQFTTAALTYAIMFLIEKNGSTSTLEVKDFLRANDYWATQTDVSKAMNDIYDELFNEGVVIKQNNGSFNVWTNPNVPDNTVVSDTITNPNDSIIDSFLSPDTSNKRTTVSPKVISEDISGLTPTDIDILYPSNCWAVYDKDFEKTIKVYDANETRDHIRSHYARVTSTPIQDVRSRRINNYNK